MNMTEGQMKVILATIKSEDFSTWYESLSDADKVLYKIIFESLHKK
jgi:hypothetical protein